MAAKKKAVKVSWSVSVGREREKKKKIAAREFRVWSPTTLLGLALSSLTTVDRTGNGAFC